MFSVSQFNPFPKKPWFSSVCSTRLLKTLWEKEKLLVTSNFSFPPVFSTHMENFLPFSSTLKLLSATSYSLEEFKIFLGEKINSSERISSSETDKGPYSPTVLKNILYLIFSKLLNLKITSD